MKQFFKALVPSFLIKHYKARHIYASYYYDAKKYIDYSNTLQKNQTKERLRADIIKRYHAVEKGLTMPDRRLFFGREVIVVLIEECNEYRISYGIHEPQVRQAVKVLYEYMIVHEDAGVHLDPELKSLITNLISDYNISISTSQNCCKVEDYFSKRDSKFKEFSLSRSSVRNYSNKEIPMQLLESAIALALHAPSACNRQPSRVVIVSNKEKIDGVLSLQNGNRGFGHLADKLLVVSVDLSGFGGSIERNLGWVDGGIFSMNLLYSLHHFGVGACPLNWAVDPERDAKLHKICGIPEHNRIVLVISCGFPNDEFAYPVSLKYSMEECVEVL